MSEAILDSPARPAAKAIGWMLRLLLLAGALAVGAVLFWQGWTAEGNPDPAAPQASHSAAILSIAVLVFREGLECILVLSAIMASMAGATSHYRRPVAVGAAIGAAGTLITWFIVVGIEKALSENMRALDLQAATGLLAIIVLLVVMNWFFHKVYWGGWIALHNRKKKELVAGAESAAISTASLLWGLGLLGFTSFYREGFEVVLFLQTYYLELGGQTVLAGAAIGLFLTGIVAVLNFIAHQKLPYRKMLVFTGVMLGAVLLVMVGEQAQEMQLANWLPTTTLPWLEPYLPGWMGLWFAIFPTVETLAAQGLAAAFVIGSYFLARRQSRS